MIRQICFSCTLLLAIGFAGAVSAASTLTIQTTDLEVSDSDPFGIDNGKCALDEALRILSGNTLLDCQPQVVGDVLPLVINLMPGVYSLTRSLPNISDVFASSVEINGNGAIIKRADSALDQFQMLRAVTALPDYKLSIRDLSFRDAVYTGFTAGLYISGWDLVLSNVTFANNHAVGQSVGQGQAGALSVAKSHINFNNCHFDGNIADRIAGAVYFAGVTGSIRATSFVSNQANTGGALYITTSSLTISRSQFTNNESSSNGGAISADYSSTPPNSLTISATTFRNNVAGIDGGAIRSLAFSTEIRNSLFQGNSAYTGGAIVRGLPFGSSYKVSNSTFTENTARFGGAIAIEHGLMQLLGDTIVGNNASQTGGGIWLDDTVTAKVSIDHSIILANTSGNGLADCQAASNQRSGVGNSILGYCGFPLLIGDRSVDINLVALASIIKPLADNGGNTKTFEPVELGFAHNSGNRGFIPPVAFDQRGYPRIAEGRVDIGAHERSAEKVQGMFDVVFNSSMESTDPWRYTDRDTFLADTMADDATGALPALGNLNINPVPVDVGSVTFIRYGNSSFFFGEFSPNIPDLPDGTDTTDIALNDLEQFDVQMSLPVTAFGFDFVDPDSDDTKFNLLACASKFDSATESCPQQDIVFSMDFSSDNALRRFFGFALVDSFEQVSIREMTNSNTNEYFGHFYTVPE